MRYEDDPCLNDCHAAPGWEVDDRLRDESGADRRARIARLRVAVDGGEAWMRAMARALLDAGIGATVRASADLAHADIAAGVFAFDAADAIRDYADAARAAAIPSATALIDRGRVLVGPPALPGRAGCWHCAYLRVRANQRWRVTDQPMADDPALAVPALLGKICASASARQPAATPLLTVIEADGGAPSFHRFLPVPGCRLCGGMSDDLPPSPSDDIDEAASQMIDRLVDPVCGLVAHLIVEPSAMTGLASPLVVTAVPADAPDEPPLAQPMPLGWGKGLSIGPAIASALGEAVERYSGSLVEPHRIIRARIDALDGDVLDPRDCALYAPDQYAREGFPFVPFAPEIAHDWVRGRWADDGAPVWVPALLTHLSLQIEREQAFVQGSSNGLAAGPDAGEASLRAMLELVERDALMTAFACNQPGRRLARGVLDEDLARIVDGISALGAEVVLALFDSPCSYPVIGCFGFGDGVRWPGATIGLGADPDPRTALRQAVLELGQTGPFLRDLMRREARPPIAPADVAEMQDHARFYFPPDRAKRLRSLIAGQPIGLPPAQERSLEECATALAGAGIRVALVDMTPADIATTGLSVVRAISPALQPIAFGHGLARMPVARLRGLVPACRSDDIAPIW